MRTIPTKETLTVEFESDVKRLANNELIDSIVGIANTKGGILYLGAEDDGHITGLHREHTEQTGFVALIANKIVPSVSVRAEIVEAENHEIMRIEIQ